jgi:hypothetical protein
MNGFLKFYVHPLPESKYSKEFDLAILTIMLQEDVILLLIRRVHNKDLLEVFVSITGSP